jgi:hypothetical protein
MSQTKLESKEQDIKKGARKIRKCIDNLFSLKRHFYGDFKYSEELGKVPDPLNLINKAIYTLEAAESEAEKIEINSL